MDTSAILALLDGDQPLHRQVEQAWNEAVSSGRPLLTSNYIAVESFALARQRMGMEAARAVADVLLPLMTTFFVTPDVHAAATAAWLAAGRRRLSFVDAASFEVMRRHGITEALALDADFELQGFRLLPQPRR